jgi:hypothetical protein
MHVSESIESYSHGILKHSGKIKGYQRVGLG